MKSYLQLFDLSQKVDYKNEILSGLTVALALIPEAIAFALIAGLSPLTGLYAAFVMGIVTSILGGRPGMISGATGAIAVVIVSLSISHGVEYIFAAVVAGRSHPGHSRTFTSGKIYPFGASAGNVWFCKWPGHSHIHGSTGPVLK